MDALFSDYDAIRKSGLFDPEYYLAAYPDVAERNLDALVHYLEEGARQGRNPHPEFDAAFYLEQCNRRGETPANPLIHYIRVGAARGFKTRRDPGKPEPPAMQTAAAGEGSAKSPILVALEALGVAGISGGRSRLSVSGWALASSPITQIAVEMDGEVVGTAAYGLARPDVARLYPERDEAGRSGFVMAFDLPRVSRGIIEPMLTVRTGDGQFGQQLLRVEIAPQEVEVGIIDPRDPARSQTRSGGKPPIRLEIDRAGVDRFGILRLEGWVLCLAQIESVEAFVDGEPIGKAELGRARAEIETEQPGYPNSRYSGFALAASVGRYGPGRKTIWVRAAARGGVIGERTIDVEIAGRPAAGAEDPGAAFRFHCDRLSLSTAGRLAIEGWALGSAPTRAVSVLLDGEEIGRAELGAERPEIANLFPALPHARQAGFAYGGDLGSAVTRERLVVLRAQLEDGRVDELQIPLSPPAGARGFAASVGSADRMLQVDNPEVIDGAAAAPVVGNLEISGWALARPGVASIEVAIDGNPMALADYGLRRLDIQAALPGWDEALTSGFSALLPHRILGPGRHVAAVTMRDRGGGSVSTGFYIDVEELSETPGPWSLRRRMPRAEVALAERILAHSRHRPMFAAVLPIGGSNASLRAARATIESVCRQVYPHWRLVIVSDRGLGKPVAGLLDGMGAFRDRVEPVSEVTPQHLAGLAGKLGVAAPDLLLAVISPGDELGCDAFLEMALATALHRDADFLYSDERSFNAASETVEAFFKPQWSPDLLMSTNYIGRLWCARSDLLASVAADTEPLLAQGEYDLVLRCCEVATAIRHLPAVLCERGEEGYEPPARAHRALERMLARRGIAGEIRPGLVPGAYRPKRQLIRPGLVSIIIPTCAAGGMIETCIATLRRLTADRDTEIICIENIPPPDRKWRQWLRRNADRVISTREPFNWSRFNNLAAAQAKGEYLLVLNDDVEITDPEWLDALLEHAQRPEVGAVGARLLYPDGRVQHAGMFLAAMGQGRHAFRYAGPEDPGYFGLALTQRNVIAVTGACLLTRRETFAALGGFDEAQAIINNDLDYCLRAWQSGRVNVYTPYATLVHHEAASRGALEDDYDVAAFDGKWRGLFLSGDPYFNRRLSKNHDDMVVEHEPTEVLVTGRPGLAREEIRKILVVKLDHIGDCVIAFPAIRRLKHHFPEARIAVLTSNASRPVWAMEPAVDETIPFDFFHPRSALGEIEHTEEDWRELRGRLSPEGFDLAIDLRKHLETRPVLQHSGARYLAGFDFRNQFPWLDFSLEWAGDQIYARKRQHNGDDLVDLVDAVAAACDSDRAAIVPPAASLSLESGLLPERSPAGPQVCVHPMAGNDMKQWPIEYFAAVIDRLAEADNARIVVIGGPGDEAVAADLLARVRHPKAVTSLVGKVPLSDLPAVISRASLFLGNDSGPKHIAAGLGVPTVGVHGGTVDVREWGPVGPAALAVARSVVCSPCYLTNPADCRRGLVCTRQLDPAQVYDACKRLLLLADPVQSPTHRDPGTKAGARRPNAKRSARSRPPAAAAEISP